MKNKTLFFSTILMIGLYSLSHAQHHGDELPKSSNTTAGFKAGSVIKQPLTDPALKDYVLEAKVMELTPGWIDTVAHRHDAELFVYVLEGSVETQLEYGTPVVYTQGQMMYEHPNVLHTLLRNMSEVRPAKLLLTFIIREGRQTYKREYPVRDTK